MVSMRDENGRFVKGHPSLAVKWTEERYNKMRDYLFKENNKIRNTGRTRFKKGRKESVEIKLKRGLSLKNNKNCVGRTPWNKGKIGEYKVESTSGENHWNWKGGRSSKNRKLRESPEWIKWRKSVFERDNFTCQDCGIKNGSGQTISFHPHHIIPLSYCLDKEKPNLIFDIDNGVTLCNKCHINIHRGEGHGL